MQWVIWVCAVGDVEGVYGGGDVEGVYVGGMLKVCTVGRC